jgi:hypothetical protein
VTDLPPDSQARITQYVREQFGQPSVILCYISALAVHEPNAALFALSVFERMMRALGSPAIASVEPEWIEWTGGVCPVDPHTEIEYRLRRFTDDDPPYRCKAGFCRWDHGRSPESSADRNHGAGLSDIIAYRVLEKDAK